MSPLRGSGDPRHAAIRKILVLILKRGPIGPLCLFVRPKGLVGPTDDRNQPAANSQVNAFSIAIGHIGVARLRAAYSMSGSI
jgi:hypothetical protein